MSNSPRSNSPYTTERPRAPMSAPVPPAEPAAQQDGGRVFARMAVNASGTMLRLSDPEMKPMMDALQNRLRHDPDYARTLLRQAGIVTAKGKLKKSFGG